MGFPSQSEQNRQEPAGEDSGHFFKADDADAIAAVAKSKRASSAGDGAARRPRKSEAADPMLPEKKRARRRLVGAIALALAVAVGLPMILDSEPKPLASDIAIQIPSKDKAPPLPVPTAAALADAPPASPDIATVDATAALGEGEEIVEAPAATQPPVTAAPTIEPKTQPQPDAKAPVKAEPAPKPVERVAEKPVGKPADDATRALAILEGKPVAAKPKADAAAAGEKFVVQVGAFASQETVAELRAKLSGAGIASYTQKTPSGATRVRVGPFATRAQADQAHAKLQKIGLSSTVVAE